MKKLLFAIAICGFVLSSCGNKTKTASAEEKACCSKVKTEASADLEKGCSKGCTHGTKTECSKEATAETKKSCCKEEKAEATAATECKGDCKKECSKES